MINLLLSLMSVGFTLSEDWSFEFWSWDLTPVFDKIYNFAESAFWSTFMTILPRIIVPLLILWLVYWVWSKFSHHK